MMCEKKKKKKSIESRIGTPKILPAAQPPPWLFRMVTCRNVGEASQKCLAEARVTLVVVDCEGF